MKRWVLLRLNAFSPHNGSDLIVVLKLFFFFLNFLPHLSSLPLMQLLSCRCSKRFHLSERKFHLTSTLMTCGCIFQHTQMIVLVNCFFFQTWNHLHLVIFQYLHKRNTILLWPGTPRFPQCPQSRWDGGTGWLPECSGGRGGRRPWRSPSEFSVEILCERLFVRALFATLCDQDVPASQ